MSDLRKELTAALNRHSAENASNTPDFILAEFLLGCLKAFDAGVNRRAQWYGRKDSPGQSGGDDGDGVDAVMPRPVGRAPDSEPVGPDAITHVILDDPPAEADEWETYCGIKISVTDDDKPNEPDVDFYLMQARHYGCKVLLANHRERMEQWNRVSGFNNVGNEVGRKLAERDSLLSFHNAVEAMFRRV